MLGLEYRFATKWPIPRKQIINAVLFLENSLKNKSALAALHNRVECMSSKRAAAGAAGASNGFHSPGAKRELPPPSYRGHYLNKNKIHPWWTLLVIF